MPWRDVKPMDEKILFIADHLREPGSFSQLCERYGISRKTGYKWVERYQTDGLEGLEERSRRPHAVVGETPYPIRKAIIELRRSLSEFLCEGSHTTIIEFDRKDSYDDDRPSHPGQAA